VPPSAGPAAARTSQRSQPERLDVAPALLEPRRVVAREKAAADDLEAGVGRVGRLRRGGHALGPGQRLDGGLQVDPGVGERELDLAAARELLGPEHAAQAREQRGQRLPGIAGRPVGPQKVDQLVAADRAAPVDDEVGEDEPALAARERDLAPAALDPQRATEPDLGRSLQVRASLTAAPRFPQGFARA
jgi:hypothetical protein